MKHVFRSGLDSLTQPSTLQEAIKVRQINLIRFKNGEQNFYKQKLRESAIIPTKRPNFDSQNRTTTLQLKRPISTYF